MLLPQYMTSGLRIRLERQMLTPTRYSYEPSRCTRRKRASGKLRFCRPVDVLEFEAYFKEEYGGKIPRNSEDSRCQEE